MTLYDQSIAVYRSRLDTLSGLLAKAAAHPKGDALLESKLADDMHPLATQIRFVTNIPGEALDRLGVQSFASGEDALTSVTKAQTRVNEMAELLDSIALGDLPSPDARIEFSIGDGAYHFELSAEEYVREFSLPNFYFHLATTYAILRSEGLEIGKADFIPHMLKYMTKGPG